MTETTADFTEEQRDERIEEAARRMSSTNPARPRRTVRGACQYCGGAVRVSTCTCDDCGRVTIVTEDGL